MLNLAFEMREYKLEDKLLGRWVWNFLWGLLYKEGERHRREEGRMSNMKYNYKSGTWNLRTIKGQKSLLSFCISPV